MFKKTKTIFLIFLIFIFYSYLFSTYSGKDTALFLKFNPEASSASMGDTYLFSASGINNPATVGLVYQPRLTLSHIEWVEDIKYSYLSFESPFSFGNLGFSLSYLGYGDIKGIDMNLEEYSIAQSYDMLFSISYGKQIGVEIPVYREYGLVGTNLKFIKSQLAQYSAESIAIDLGTIVNIGLITGLEKIERLRASLTYKNLGSKMKFVKKENSLPSGLNFGIGIDYPQLKKLEFGLAVDIPDNSNPVYSLGFSITPVYFLVLRCGYKHTHNSVSDGLTGGFGVNLGSVRFDYAVKRFSEFKTLGGLGLIHQVSIGIALGSFINQEIASEYYIKQHLNKAYEFYYQKEYQLAKERINEILNIYSNYKAAIVLLQKIENTIKKENEDKEKQINNWLKKAEIFLEKKDYINSKRYYTQVLRLDKENTQAQQGIQTLQKEIESLQQERIKQKNAKKIEKIWQEAVKIYKEGNFIKSKEKFKEILLIDPNHEPTKNYITEIETQISLLNAEQINSLYLQGVELFNNKKYLEASKYFEAVVLASPDRIDAGEYLKKCKQAIEEEEERKRQEEIAKLQNENRKEMERIFITSLKFYEKSDYIKALDMFNEAVKVAEKYQFNEYLEKSKNYINNIKLELSEQYYKKGYQLYQQNKFEQAYEEYSKSLQYNPNNITVQNEIGRLKEKLAQKYYDIGISYYTKGETEKAREFFNRSLYYMPKKEETLRALERIK